MYVIWLDDTRAREALKFAHATWAQAAMAAGAKRHEIDDWDDPADLLDDTGGDDGDTSTRAADPAERAAQIRAFLAAAGGETTTPGGEG